ncbi:MAG: cytochrome c3 family protein [Rubrivivax sp.]|nr:cytochrome c3 family protein [Rubrivivax sp.]
MKRWLVLIAAVVFAAPLHAASVVGSRHDLSSSTTPQVCVFCHTPHHANVNLPSPLWNRAETTQTFTLYGSPSMDMIAAQPRASSRLCLSCHDGVNASTMVNGFSVGTKHDVVSPPGAPRPDRTTWANCERCHTDIATGGRRKLVLGTDLRNDHPISIGYPTAAQDAGFNQPPDPSKGWGGGSAHEVKLYSGGVECGSCHNVHDPAYGNFLRKPNSGSALCLTCHKK